MNHVIDDTTMAGASADLLAAYTRTGYVRRWLMRLAAPEVEHEARKVAWLALQRTGQTGRRSVMDRIIR